MTRSYGEVRFALAPGASAPVRMSENASGWDLSAMENRILTPGETALVRTGLTVDIPSGYEGQVRPRSGLALKHGVTVLNAPGTIDADYRGEIGVILCNLGSLPFTITAGDRIAQLIIAPVPFLAMVQVASVDELSPTARGTGGFGHTGI